MDSARSWLQKLQPRDKDIEWGAKTLAPAPTSPKCSEAFTSFSACLLKTNAQVVEDIDVIVISMKPQIGKCRFFRFSILDLRE